MLVFNKSPSLTLQNITKKLINNFFCFLLPFFETAMLLRRRIKYLGKGEKLPTRILVFCLDNLGDLLLTTPVVRSLKERYPSAELNLFISAQQQDVYKYNPFPDTIVPLKMSNNKFKFTLELWEVLRKYRNADTVIILERYNLLCRIILLVISFLPNRKIYCANLTLPFFYKLFFRFEESVNKLYLVDYYYQVLNDLLSVQKTNQQLLLYYSKDEEEKIAALMEEYKLKDGRYIVFCPFARKYGWLAKDLPLNVSVNLLTKLTRELSNIRLVIVGAKEEINLSSSILENIKGDNSRVVNLVGRLKVNELGLFLRKAALLLTVDTGVLHIGVSQGVKIVPLFGPTRAEELLPCRHREKALYSSAKCAKCFSNYKRITFCKEKNCMHYFNLDQIIDVVKKELNTWLPN